MRGGERKPPAERIGGLMGAATVISKKGTREGRGFSLEELKAAGVSLLEARRRALRVDRRRRSLHDLNVETLRKLFEKKEKEVRRAARKVTKGAGGSATPAKREGIPIEKIKGVGPKRVGQLAQAGITTAEGILEVDLEALSKKSGVPLKTLQKYVSEARKAVKGT
jgi:large subunit ribosomal protein L13e